jgi:DNA repair protein SbcD/Mre11
MARFLHLADIHLGFDRYDSKARTQDFFYAFYDAIEKYAIAPQVDFVILAGDLFEHRNIQPVTLNQAQVVLQALKEAGIPVLAIEGNHDNRPYGTKTSWLRYLADWELLILLEPGDVAAGEPFYSPWDGRHGGYIDLECGVRVLGSYWYGSTAPKAIEQIAEAMQSLPPTPHPNVLIFHHGMEGQIARYQGALRYAEVLPLKDAGVNYLALGHIHKNYEMEGWIFNPGSTEANSVEESTFDRGVYSVDISSEGVKAELKQDFRQRSILRLKMTLRGAEAVEDVEAAAIALIQEKIEKGKLNPDVQPIVELRIDGQLGFERLELNTRQLQQQLQAISSALIFLLKFEAESVSYLSPVSDDAHRLQIEQDVFMDLLSAHNSYKKRSGELAQGLINLKDLQMEGRSESELYDFVQTLLIAEEP